MLSPASQLILSSAKLEPSVSELERLNDLIPQIENWDGLVAEIIVRQTAPLFFKKLPLLTNRNLIPAEATAKLQQAYYKSLSRGMVLYSTFEKVAEAFCIAGIQVVVLKGIYLSEWLYGDIALRQFSDMDLLVKKEDALQCLSILKNLGFKPSDAAVTEFISSQSEIVHYAPMVLNNVSVEVHIKLHRQSKHYDIKIDAFLSNAEKLLLRNKPVYGLELHDLLIHLCVHLDKHFRGGHVQFTSFNDIVNLLEKFKNEIDWTLLGQRSDYHACEQTVFKFLVLIHKFYNAALPKAILSKYGALLSKEDEDLFIEYLNGVSVQQYHVDFHWQNIRRIKGLAGKMHYMLDLIFPPRKFMLQKYGIQQPAFFWLWYPYRYYVGLKGLCKLLAGRVAN